MNQTFETIQKEMVDWQNYNFPGREPWMPLMGLGEELAELAEAGKEDDVLDAIGDCMIYMVDYCNGMEYSISIIVGDSKHYSIATMLGAFKCYGKLLHAHLKKTQKIRMHEEHDLHAMEELSKIVSYLDWCCSHNLERITWKVWEKVRQRDWQKNRNTAHEG